MQDTALRRMMSDRKYLRRKLDFYTANRQLFRIASQAEIAGHLTKARHNLEFLNEIRDSYSDWIVVVAYYAAYHASLALIISRGLFSKNHDATLCALVSEFYNEKLTAGDIGFLNSLRVQDILFYASLRTKRKDASYSSKILFEGMDVRRLRLDTIAFVNKAEHLINH
jgi:uncharacterized protein (UPF0332 family)